MKKSLLLLLLCYCLHAQAQTLQPVSSLFNAIGTPIETFDKTLTKKGFRIVYGGPKKEGGYLCLYSKKSTDEWLFIHGNSQMDVLQFDYYLPTLKQVQKLHWEKKLSLLGEELSNQGLVEYEGKKYYHLVFRKEKMTLPSRKFSKQFFLQNTEWLSHSFHSGIVGVDDTKCAYQFYKSKEERGKWAGDIFRLVDSIRFVSYYTAWCGNDCFTTVEGNYKFLSADTINFFVEKITTQGYCKDTIEYPRKDFGSFKILMQQDTLRLQRIDFNLSTTLKSLETLCHAMELQDTVLLRQVVSKQGYKVLLSENEVGLNHFTQRANEWLVALKNGKVKIKVRESGDNYEMLEVTMPGTAEDLNFIKENGQWKFLLIARDE